MSIEKIVGGVAALMQEPPPDQCPIPLPGESERLQLLELRQVPERLRSLLVAVLSARRQLNCGRRTPLTGHSLNRLWNAVDEAATELDAQLRRIEQLPAAAIIEYHGDWRFSTTTLEKERARWKRPAIEVRKPSGLDLSWRERPPERSHICFAVVGNGIRCPHLSG